MNKPAKITLLFIADLVAPALIFAASLNQPAPVEPPKHWLTIVPHHDLMKTTRQTFWQDFLAKHPTAASATKIILIGPDHFGSLPDKITYTDENFSLHSGKLQNLLKNTTLALPNVVKNTTLIKSDHAVSTLLSEFATNFPHASLAPFLIGSGVKFAALTDLTTFIQNQCTAQAQCLIVASVDFSHDLNLAAATQKDRETIDQLQNLTITQNSLSVPENADCPTCLYALQELARGWGNSWWLWGNTNSAGDNHTIRSTVSHIYGGYLPQ